MRLSRVGSAKNPIYRIVVADARSPRDGRSIETIGHYNPQVNPSLIEIDKAKAEEWLRKGVQPTQTVKRLLATQGIDW
jgi:small subunit ribosomal protein S16